MCQQTIIAYDSTDDRRRRQVVKIVEGYGVRVQYSVFEAWLTTEQVNELEEKLAAVIDPKEDSVLILPLDAWVSQRVRRLGLLSARGRALYLVA